MLLLLQMILSYEQQRLARCINGQVVSESESDDPEEYLNVTNSIEARKKLVLKKRVAIRRRAKRLEVRA